jgi:hypothetical protein
LLGNTHERPYEDTPSSSASTPSELRLPALLADLDNRLAPSLASAQRLQARRNGLKTTEDLVVDDSPDLFLREEVEERGPNLLDGFGLVLGVRTLSEKERSRQYRVNGKRGGGREWKKTGKDDEERKDSYPVDSLDRDVFEQDEIGGDLQRR